MYRGGSAHFELPKHYLTALEHPFFSDTHPMIDESVHRAPTTIFIHNLPPNLDISRAAIQCLLRIPVSDCECEAPTVNLNNTYRLYGPYLTYLNSTSTRLNYTATLTNPQNTTEYDFYEPTTYPRKTHKGHYL